MAGKFWQGMHFYTIGMLRRIYDWVLSLAHKKYSTASLAGLAFVESSFFPIPPDVLQIALSLSKPKKAYWYAFIAAVFSVLGGILGYFIGMFLFDVIGQQIISALSLEQQFVHVGDLFKDNAFLTILAAAFTPIPYKVFTIAAGVWQVGLGVLIIASVIGRSLRFFIIATLIYFFGEKVKGFIDRYFNWLTLAFFALIVLVIVLIKIL